MPLCFYFQDCCLALGKRFVPFLASCNIYLTIARNVQPFRLVRKAAHLRHEKFTSALCFSPHGICEEMFYQLSQDKSRVWHGCLRVHEVDNYLVPSGLYCSPSRGSAGHNQSGTADPALLYFCMLQSDRLCL